MNTKIAQLPYQKDMDRYNQLLSEILKELNEKNELLQKSVAITAQNLGTKPIFISEEELNSRIININKEYRKFKEVVRLRLNPNAQGHIGANQISEFNKEINDVELAASDLETSISHDPRALIEKPEPIHWHEKLIIASPFLLLAGASLYETSGFALVVGNMIFAFLISVTFSIAQYMGLRLATKCLMKWTDNRKKKLLILGVLTFAAGIFLGLGWYRDLYMQKQGTTVPSGPIVFMLISLLFLIGAWIGEFISVSIRKKMEQKVKDLDKYQGFADAQNELRNLKDTKASLETERSHNVQMRLLNMDHSDTYFKRIKNDYESTVSLFKTRYLEYRNGRDTGLIPDYFTYVEIPPVIDEDDWSILHQHQQKSKSGIPNY